MLLKNQFIKNSKTNSIITKNSQFKHGLNYLEVLIELLGLIFITLTQMKNPKIVSKLETENLLYLYLVIIYISQLMI